MTLIVNRIAQRILAALDSGRAHDVTETHIVRLLDPAPRFSPKDVATNQLLIQRLGLDLITADSLESDLLGLGVTSEELDELLG